MSLLQLQSPPQSLPQLQYLVLPLLRQQLLPQSLPLSLRRLQNQHQH